jgi:YD repeat-containing protein
MRIAQGRQHGLPMNGRLVTPKGALAAIAAAFALALFRPSERMRLVASGLLLVGLAFSAQADVQYVYDSVGRVVQVITADGSSAQYQYDSAGNISKILRFAASDLAITAFNPATGAAGGQITLQGSGFSTTPAANAVSFNGTSSTVLSATANRLVVQVPSGATTGPIAVIVGGNTVTSAQNFVVGVAPTISGFSPTVVNAGASVTVSGSNFNPVPGSTHTAVDGAMASMSSISATAITFNVPLASRSGPITVTQPYGQETSATPLIVVPATIGATNVVSSGQLGSSGSPASLTIASGKYGVFAFQATQGQYLSVQISSLSTTPSGAAVGYQIFAPNGVVLTSGSASPSNTSIHLRQIQSTGTYLLAVAAGSVVVQISAALDINPVFNGSGQLTGITTTGAKQSKRFVLAASAGQDVGVGLRNLVTTPSSFNSVTLAMNKPDGSPQTNNTCYTSSPGGSCNLWSLDLPQTGNYLITLVPGEATISFDLAVSQAVSGALVAGTPLNLSLPVAGQFAELTFEAAANQAVAVNIGSLVTTPANQNIFFAVYNSSGSTIASTSDSGSQTFNLGNLAAGTYRVVVVPWYGLTATAQVALANSALTTVPTDGTSGSYSTSLPGQNAYFTFAATAGQDIGVGLTSLTLAPNSGNATLTVNKPDGSFLNNVSCSTSTAGGTCAINLLNLPQTGNYRIIVAPPGPAIMSFSLSVSQAVTGTLTAGTPLNVNMASIGQFALLSFTATAGQTVAVNVGSIVTSPASQNVWVGIYDANGTQITGSGTSSGLTYNLTNLAAGTYKVYLSPYYGVSATAQVKLVNGVTSTVPTDDTTGNYSTSLPGQNAYFTFAATAGQDIGVGLTSLTLAPNSGNATLTVNKPDGSFLNNVSCSTSTAGGTCAINLLNLPQTGNYRIIVAPPDFATMSFALSISQPVTGTLTAGTPLNVNLPVIGKFAMLTFTATAGQTVALNVGSITTAPAGQNVWVGVYNPSGAQVVGSGTNSTLTYNLTNLQAGTYKVYLSPYYGVTAALQATLVNGLTATVPTDGTSASFSTSVPAQNGYFTFAATAGQNIGVGLTGLTLTPNSGSATLAVYKPDGSSLSSTSCSPSTAGATCAINLLNVPQTGNYLVTVAPVDATTMTFALSVSQAVSGTLTAGTPLNLNLAAIGQFAVLTFTASAGQTVVLNVGSIVTNPANQNVWVGVYNPSGTQLAAGGTATALTHTLTNLPAGTYKVHVSPYYGVTASVQVSL